MTTHELLKLEDLDQWVEPVPVTECMVCVLVGPTLKLAELQFKIQHALPRGEVRSSKLLGGVYGWSILIWSDADDADVSRWLIDQGKKRLEYWDRYIRRVAAARAAGVVLPDDMFVGDEDDV